MGSEAQNTRPPNNANLWCGINSRPVSEVSEVSASTSKYQKNWGVSMNKIRNTQRGKIMMCFVGNEEYLRSNEYDNGQVANEVCVEWE